jgi:hypothetical protein
MAEIGTELTPERMAVIRRILDRSTPAGSKAETPAAYQEAGADTGSTPAMLHGGSPTKEQP